MVVPLVLTVLALGFFLVRLRLDAVEQENAVLAGALAENVQIYLDASVSALGYLARLHDMDASPMAMASAVRSLQADMRFERILLLDSANTVLEAHPTGMPGLDFPVFFPSAAATRNVASRPLYSAETGLLTIYLRHPASRGNVVVGELNLSALQNHLKTFSPASAEVVFLCDAFGNVIAHPDPLLVRTQANLGGMPLLREAEASGGPQPHFAFFRHGGEAWFGTVLPISGPGWRLVILNSARSVLMPIASPTGLFLIVALCYVAFLALLTVDQLRRHIVLPVNDLTEAIDDVARGDHARPIATQQGFRELALMARRFEDMVRTVAEREEALRLSRENYRSIFENAAEGIVQTTPEGRVLSANPAAARIFGLPSPEDALTRFTDIGTQIYADPADRQRLMRALSTKGEAFMQVPVRRVDGQNLWVEVHSRAVLNEDGSIAHIESILSDITERREAEERLRASLTEKDVLLKEIHHRVKNNLQIISSLLYLQTLSLKDEEAQTAFQESQNRIATMALVHEELYRSKDFSRVDLREYAHKLVARVLQGIGNGRVRVEHATQELRLPLQTAIPCGLVLNELVTNAVKHAFAGPGEHALFVTIRAEDGMGVLLLEDNGKGLPFGFKPEKCETLGMQLVTRLAIQIGGRLEAGPSPRGGASFRLVFPLIEGDGQAPLV
ncbi:signal transduction histidine kinase [Alkalidesulfovibrio alkalitolerans DSM 16529]|uniref:histidine kinase n=2 Tax=Alkalidesulfovibrio alkalitolerans TaxID=293256 RepID=S7UNS5_9BACT|nr:signal transduction histidine kinase [Alkalidesulfovibrio alkalitolerans DSM 16529]